MFSCLHRACEERCVAESRSSEVKVRWKRACAWLVTHDDANRAKNDGLISYLQSLHIPEYIHTVKYTQLLSFASSLYHIHIPSIKTFQFRAKRESKPITPDA